MTIFYIKYPICLYTMIPKFSSFHPLDATTLVQLMSKSLWGSMSPAPQYKPAYLTFIMNVVCLRGVGTTNLRNNQQ